MRSDHSLVTEAFLAVADLDEAQRTEWYQAHQLAPGLRAEVEAMVRADSADALSTGVGEDFVVDSLVSLDAAIPKQLGPFRIVGRVGRGSMGDVLAARQEHPKRQAAVKLLRSAFSYPGARARFQHEVDLLARLDHPGIVQLYEAGVHELDDGSELAWFAMPLLAGEPLDVAAEALPLPERVELIRQVCAAMAHAHQRGVVHRDLKPSNILVDAQGRAHVLDFGIAASEAHDHTKTGQVLGTLAYMSPEQALGRAHDVDARSDVYALGVLLYQLIAGHLPIDVGGLDLLSAANRIASQAPAPLPPTVPTDLSTLVMHCLNKEPDRRYSTANALLEDLERYQSRRPLLARPPSLVYTLQCFARRRKGTATAMLAVGVAVALGAWGTTRGFQQAQRERDAALAANTQAQTVERFLIDTLSDNGSGQHGADILLRDAIDLSASALDNRFGERDLTRAHISVALAEIYANQGRLTEGLALIGAALPALEAELGPDNAQVLAARGVRAKIIGGRDPISGARQLQELSRRCAAILGRAHPTCLNVRSRWLSSEVLELPPTQWLAKLDRLLEDLATVEGPQGPALLRMRTRRAEVLRRLGRLEEAERSLRAILQQAEEHHGPLSAPAWIARDALVSLLRDQQRLLEQTPLLRQRLTAARFGGGALRRRAIEAETDLIRNLSRVGERQEAHERAEALVTRLEDSLENLATRDYATTMGDLADAYRATGDLAGAVRVSRQALARVEGELPPSHPGLGVLRGFEARSLKDMGRFEEAVAAYPAAIAASETSLGPNHQNTLKLRKDYASSLVKVSRREEANGELMEVERRARAHLGDGHVLVRSALAERTENLLALGRFKMARQVADLYLRTVRGMPSPSPITVAQALMVATNAHRAAESPDTGALYAEASTFIEGPRCAAGPACSHYAALLLQGLGDSP